MLPQLPGALHLAGMWNPAWEQQWGRGKQFFSLRLSFVVTYFATFDDSCFQMTTYSLAELNKKRFSPCFADIFFNCDIQCMSEQMCFQVLLKRHGQYPWVIFPHHTFTYGGAERRLKKGQLFPSPSCFMAGWYNMCKFVSCEKAATLCTTRCCLLLGFYGAVPLLWHLFLKLNQFKRVVPLLPKYFRPTFGLSICNTN